MQKINSIGASSLEYICYMISHGVVDPVQFAPKNLLLGFTHVTILNDKSKRAHSTSQMALQKSPRWA